MSEQRTPSRPNASMLGTSGLKQYGGYIQEEYLNELSGDRWWKAIAEMSNDPTIAGILFAIQMLIRQTPMSVAPFSEEEADKEIAEHIESCLHDMRDTLALTLAEILTFLPWGYAPLEIVYKVRGGEVRKGGNRDTLRSSKYDDGKVGWACWAIRSQDTISEWDFTPEGEPIAFFQVAPPFYHTVRIPLAKCLHFRASSRKGNPEGLSIFRGVYRPWYFKKKIENIEGIGIERDLAGLPVAKVPAQLLSAERTAIETSVYNAIKQIVTNIRRDEQEGVVWPIDRDEKGNPLYELELLSTGGTRQFDTSAIIERYDTRIAMSVLADFILVGHQQSGSYSLVSSKTTMFANALGAWLDTICETINGAIPELLRFNGYDDARPPRLQHGDVEKIDIADLGAFITALTGAKGGGLFDGPAGPRMLNYLLEQAGLPTPTDAESAQAQLEQEERERAEAEEKAEQLALLAQRGAQQAPPQAPPPQRPQREPEQAAERYAELDGLLDSILDEAFDLAGRA